MRAAVASTVWTGRSLDLAAAVFSAYPVDLPFLTAGALAGDEVDGDVLLEGVDVGVRAHAIEQAGLYRMPGGVGRMHHAALGMAAFARQVQTAVHLRIWGEGNAVGSQPGDHFACLARHHAGDRFVAQAGAGNQGVADVGLDRVAAVDRGGNTALRPVAGTVGHLALVTMATRRGRPA